MPPDARLSVPLVAAGALPAMLEPARTALVVIDVQVDFVAPEGAMGRSGADLAPLETALPRIDSLIAAARSAGATLVFPRVITRAETDSTALKLLMSRRGLPPDAVAICRESTAGADYYHVRPMSGDIEISKTLYSSFAGTPLERELRARGIDTLVVVGFTTECCVDCTVRDAFHRGFNVFVVIDACAAYTPDLHYGALNGLANNCALLIESAAVLAAWSSPAAISIGDSSKQQRDNRRG